MARSGSSGKAEAPVRKEAISIRIDEDVLAWFRALGPGWQTRINAVLRAYSKREETKR